MKGFIDVETEEARMYPESVVYTGVMLECATPGVLGHSIQVLVLSEENLKMLLHLLLSG